MGEASQAIQEYFEKIQEELKRAYLHGNKARSKGYDPEEHVDIVLAKNMAERVEGLIREVAPQLIGTGMVGQIFTYEKKYGRLDWRVGFRIAEDVAKQQFCQFKSEEEAMEVGVRVGFAYLTLGIVSAPLEGFTFLKIKSRKDGKKYVSLWYSGPIRGAGGTAAATSAVLGDYIRSKMGYELYDPTEDEVNRIVTEVQDYHERVTNLQYFPSEEEIRFMASHLPIELNGEPTEKIEVSNFKDLPRVETNSIRGGICLVIAEGLCQKAPKIWKRLSKWGEELGLGHWSFLSEFLDVQKAMKARKMKTGDAAKSKKLSPNFVYIQDLVAGRPVLSYPMREGGFRLRYGRSRISGFSSACIHPATMHLLSKYIATGTQLKLERPGKATAVTPNDSIEGPIVRLKDRSVLLISSEEEAIRLKDNVEQILFLGDLLVSYGDFSENGHVLVPTGYNEDWHAQNIKKALASKFGSIDSAFGGIGSGPEIFPNVSLVLKELMESPNKAKISAENALRLSDFLGIPQHPQYTYHWALLEKQSLAELLTWLSSMKVAYHDGQAEKAILPFIGELKQISDNIGIPCTVVQQESVVFSRDTLHAIFATFGVDDAISLLKVKDILANTGPDVRTLDFINSVSKARVMDKSGTFIGARMGRPEKAKMRKLSTSPHVLFPIGEEGGRLRSVQSAADSGKITADLPIYHCPKCRKNTIYAICEACDNKCIQKYYCRGCSAVIDKPECPKHGKALTYMNQAVDSSELFSHAISKLSMQTWPDLIKGVRGTSNRDHIPENLAKGILRAKHELFVNKDGTIRYDMTELPITHFKPGEIGTSINKLKEMGYTKDIYGKQLENDSQLIEIKPQDIILPASTDGTDEPSNEVLFRAAMFIDELLVKLYGVEPYYSLSEKSQLIGQLVIGLAPHISAGMVGRIIGFSETQACFAHPLWHAALRRDCDGDECCVMMLMDGLLNFSRQFLPDRRGSRTMDSPLVLTSILNPAEVDDMVQGLDVVWDYPLDLYEAGPALKNPWEIKVEQLGGRLNTPLQYENIGFTHDVTSINEGVKCSAYKTLPSMEDKLKGQMEIAERIRAVDASDVARLVIEKHFLRDIRGNLRKFSQQEFRCVKCNSKFRRPPLRGKCTDCGGRLIFTVSEGNIMKYLQPSISLATKYSVSTYLKQTLELTKIRVEGMFGRDPEKQTGLGSWFS